MLHTSTDATDISAHKGRGYEYEKVFAALDLGTNNCRLLIAAPYFSDGDYGIKSTGGIKVFDSFSRIVKLGEGVAVNGFLSAEAMERTMNALKTCQKKISRYNISASRFIATEACRRAKNGEEFLKQVFEETGMDIKIISTEEEAKLAFSGCAALLGDKSEKALVFDIGGGSTEIMWVDATDNKKIADWLSIGFGVMNLSDKFGGSNLADITFNDMVETLTERLREFDKVNNINASVASGNVQLLSTSGTVTTLAAIHLELPRYDRTKVDGITLPVKDIRNTTRKLLGMRQSERFNHPCIGADRADFILSGCAIFEAITNVWQIDKITIADRGVREGIILSLLQEKAI